MRCAISVSEKGKLNNNPRNQQEKKTQIQNSDYLQVIHRLFQKQRYGAEENTGEENVPHQHYFRIVFFVSKGFYIGNPFIFTKTKKPETVFEEIPRNDTVDHHC